MGERTETLFRLWKHVNELADIEDSRTIRYLIAEAGIEPDMHVGTEPDDFTPEMVAEWVLGQWADGIDRDSPFLNSLRNVSFHQYEQATGEEVETTVGDHAWHLKEIAGIAERLATDG